MMLEKHFKLFSRIFMVFMVFVILGTAGCSGHSGLGSAMNSVQELPHNKMATRILADIAVKRVTGASRSRVARATTTGAL